MALGRITRERGVSSIKILLLIFFVLNLSGLSSCTNSDTKNDDKKESSRKMEVQEARVFVFKYDGSLQCEKESRIPIEVMQRQLDNIKIFSSESKNDGLFRSQVCGSPTGQMNVYEILETDFKTAKKLGFKKLEMDKK